ncbi:hypothetical protein QTG54_015659 [Skeletonema marinoi]|uniref:MYND-type domain-containing protein n=1 Tax=Skeletonema marinoi TaxID=267567 RepID=A0AAD9D4F2_9STRA|nr:hypothetical protein QTG54_015659 [Skeletonema marinoi]
MSEDNTSNKSCCAACGVAEVDEVKLKECTSCDLVRYCCDECQRDHKSQHEDACNKRAVELRVEILFKQPESSNRGDCPICCLPLSLDTKKSIMMSCCSKLICKGCTYANQKREYEGRLGYKCPFCRTAIPSTVEADKMMMKRIEANDPAAMCQWGREKYDKGDYSSAFELYTKAAQLGDAEAHYQLAVLYHEKDRGKEIHHLKEAAIGGHPDARFNLGCDEEESGNIERAVKHWIIAANLGDDGSIKELMEYFKEGKVSKDDLAATLRAHQAAVDAIKSPQRDAAEEYY